MLKTELLKNNLIIIDELRGFPLSYQYQFHYVSLLTNSDEK